MVTHMHAFKQCNQWSCAPGRKSTRMYNCTIMIRPGFTFNSIQRSTKAKVLELSYTQIKWNYTGYFRINQSAGAVWLKFLVGFYILLLTNGLLSSNKPPTAHYICFYKGRHCWTWLWNIHTLYLKITLQPLIIVHVLTKVVQGSICKHYHGKKMSPASS